MNIFKHTDYRDLINEALETKLGRGSKIKLAEKLNCHPGYISQVLKKSKIQFSPENILKISSFLDFNQTEEEYLLNLLQMERAGSSDLRKYWERKIKKAQDEHSKIESRIKDISKDLSESAKATYYSHWAYGAIHMLVSIGKFKNSDEMAKKINLNNKLTNKVVIFLEEHGLIVKEKSYFTIGKTRIHLKANSPLIKTHHQNFRQKAILALEEENDFNLHYSSVLTLSKKDCLKVRDLVLKLIADKETILIPSANEEIICLNLDIFKVCVER